MIAIEANTKGVLREKRSYVQTGTSWFFLIDQRIVTRVNVTERVALDEALSSRAALPKEIATTWTWIQLCEADAFAECFGVLSTAQLELEAELQRFRRNETPFSYLDASGDGRALFGETVRTASELLREAVVEIIETGGIPDLAHANEILKPMIADYGLPIYDWADPQRPISFEHMLDRKLRDALSEKLVVEYERRRQELMADLESVLYVLRLEHDLLQQYAERQGGSSASSANEGASLICERG